VYASYLQENNYVGVFPLLHSGLLGDDKDYWNIFGDVAKSVIAHVSSIKTQSS
jgi:hypothetical protein